MLELALLLTYLMSAAWLMWLNRVIFNTKLTLTERVVVLMPVGNTVISIAILSAMLLWLVDDCAVRWRCRQK